MSNATVVQGMPNSNTQFSCHDALKKVVELGMRGAPIDNDTDFDISIDDPLIFGSIAALLVGFRAMSTGERFVNVQGVLDDIDERKKKGIETYGVPLSPFNGRDMYIDAYQELLDFGAYCVGARAERDNSHDLQTFINRVIVI